VSDASPPVKERMPQMSLTDWIAAIGSIASGVATLVAILALLYSVQSYNKDQEQQKAAQIRQNLGTLRNRSNELSTLLTDGSVLIYGSSSVTKELRSRLPSTATSKEFWEYLSSDDGLLLSIAVEGWLSSPQTTILRDVNSQIEQAALSLNGLLLILSYAQQLLKGIVDDGYSPIIFLRILSLLGKNSQYGKFFHDHEKEDNINKLINAVNLELQGDSALYFKLRYYDAVSQLTLFLMELSEILIDLEDSKLISISKTESKSAPTEATRTGSIKILLQKLKPYFPPEKHDKLLELVNEIEKSVSKEQASKNLGTPEN